MTTTDDLYQRASCLYEAAYYARRTRTPHADGIRAVVDLVLAERPEPTDWETLRAAAAICDRQMRSGTASKLRNDAERLEAEHAAAQAEAAADAARDALIEKANAIFREAWHAEDARSGGGSRVTAGMKAVADAGLLVDPEAEATA
ncbi:hypothetical protein [Gordonia sp. (in: high G+C Gram-positive bacteria)]|uniref:hypothetical protein n=1 Tax=Gordonia sp. (in: high G+C Gram-positive bacteria) TaxID=84139 RepID=UPI003C73E731